MTIDCKRSGLAIDLGATWYWPENQPLVTSLVAELGLDAFPQHDDGVSLRLNNPDQKAESVEVSGVHGGAQRLTGGTGRLIAMLAGELPKEKIYFEHVLIGLRDAGDHVVMTFRSGEQSVEIAARRVVLALPPRLVEERVACEPGFEESLRTAMRETPTWMAAQAKAIMTYDGPVWRSAGQSGNAFVTHEQAVFNEIFDACDKTSTQAALGGFVALGPELRESFAVGMPVLMQSQMEQVFGVGLAGEEQHYQDWAKEPETCSALDLEAQHDEHSGFSNPMLRRAFWAGKLYLGGSETASRAAGYMEGALETARRIGRELLRVTDADVGAPPDAAGGPEALNANSLARFTAWVGGQADAAFDDYRRHLAVSLAAQQREQLTQRAMLTAAESVYARALTTLADLPFNGHAAPVEQGRSALTPEIQKPFGDFLRQFFDDVVAFNRTSCALSNFPGEHHLSKDYEQTILRDLAAAWKEFSLSANRLLLAKADLAPAA
jgi:monoamine oxidase